MTRGPVQYRIAGRRFLPGLIVLLLTITGCGYSTKSSLDPKYQTIAINAFLDQSKEYDLQAPLTNAVIRKFMADGRLRVVPADQADLILEGMVRNYSLRGLSFDRNDAVTQFICVVTAGVRVKEAKTGKVLWQDPAVSGETTFFTRGSGQSADHLHGNAETFVGQVRSFATEEENRGASQALEQLASGIFYRTIEPW